jgi:hypothetical protein
MLPMRHSTIFKSRWMALLWAAGIILFAYQIGSAQPQDDSDAADANQLAQTLNGF